LRKPGCGKVDVESGKTGRGAGAGKSCVESGLDGGGAGGGRIDVGRGETGTGKRADLAHRDLSDRIIAAAIAVHTALGPGFLEKVYENELGLELAARGLRFEQQNPVRVFYRDTEIAEHRLDLVVEDLFLVELKAVRELEDIFFIV